MSMSEVERLMHVAWGECKELVYDKSSWIALYRAITERHYPPASASTRDMRPPMVERKTIVLDDVQEWLEWMCNTTMSVNDFRVEIAGMLAKVCASSRSPVALTTERSHPFDALARGRDVVQVRARRPISAHSGAKVSKGDVVDAVAYSTGSYGLRGDTDIITVLSGAVEAVGPCPECSNSDRLQTTTSGRVCTACGWSEGFVRDNKTKQMPSKENPIPPGARWEGNAVVLRDGGQVTVDADGMVIHQHRGRTDVFDKEEFAAAKAVLARAEATRTVIGKIRAADELIRESDTT